MKIQELISIGILVGLSLPSAILAKDPPDYSKVSIIPTEVRVSYPSKNVTTTTVETFKNPEISVTLEQPPLSESQPPLADMTEVRNNPKNKGYTGRFKLVFRHKSTGNVLFEVNVPDLAYGAYRKANLQFLAMGTWAVGRNSGGHSLCTIDPTRGISFHIEDAKFVKFVEDGKPIALKAKMKTGNEVSILVEFIDFRRKHGHSDTEPVPVGNKLRVKFHKKTKFYSYQNGLEGPNSLIQIGLGEYSHVRDIPFSEQMFALDFGRSAIPIYVIDSYVVDFSAENTQGFKELTLYKELPNGKRVELPNGKKLVAQYKMSPNDEMWVFITPEQKAEFESALKKLEDGKQVKFSFNPWIVPKDIVRVYPDSILGLAQHTAAMLNFQENPDSRSVIADQIVLAENTFSLGGSIDTFLVGGADEGISRNLSIASVRSACAQSLIGESPSCVLPKANPSWCFNQLKLMNLGLPSFR